MDLLRKIGDHSLFVEVLRRRRARRIKQCPRVTLMDAYLKSFYWEELALLLVLGYLVFAR